MRQLVRGGSLRIGIHRRGWVSGICGIVSVSLALGLSSARGYSQAGTQPVQPGEHSAAKAAPHATGKKRRTKARAVKPAPALVLPPAPPPPPAPNWPALASPKPAEVHWDGNKLSVTAANSSLQQILQAVSEATGVAVEGMGSDQRVFGEYGPATARQVLSQLLEGSGYDLMMVGDGGDGKPRKVVLTARSAASAEAPPRPAYATGATGAAGGVSAGGEELVNPEAPRLGQWTVGKPQNNGATAPAGGQPDVPQGAPNGSNPTPQQVNQRNAAPQQQPPQ